MEILKTAVQVHQLGISGSGEKLTYVVSEHVRAFLPKASIKDSMLPPGRAIMKYFRLFRNGCESESVWREGG